MSRPLVSVFDPASTEKVVAQVNLPAVMTAPIRPDIVHYVHTLMAKNKRQAYAVSLKAGMQTPAESWGTGRAVSRIPRVPGGGTSRSGQGAFGNMCRGGRMFAPTKTWRRWHKKINVNQRRYAVASALAASALPVLVSARGHQIMNVPELPLVFDDSLTNISHTKEAKAVLQRYGAFDDVVRCDESKKVRRGVGKTRNRRYTMRRGPLVIYDNKEKLAQAFRNLPGVELASVENLNLLQLAPGGHLGRFCIWTKGAFDKLDNLFGTYDGQSSAKKSYTLPRTMMNNADLARLINSDEVQSIVRPAVTAPKTIPVKRNPLRHHSVMVSLNPHAEATRARAIEKAKKNKEAHAAVVKARREERGVRKAFANRKKQFFAAASKDGEISV